MMEHWFWFLMTIAVVAWYCTITIYVALRGALDIKHMLQNLSDHQRRTQGGTGKAE